MTEYRLRYAAPLRLLLSALGMGPGLSGVAVGDEQLRVRMGWAFSARVPRSAIRRAEPSAHPIWGGWGVHGWNGHWLVNGSSHGIVRLDFDPRQRALVCGVPVRLRTLWLGLEDPDLFLAGLGSAPARRPPPSGGGDIDAFVDSGARATGLRGTRGASASGKQVEGP
jgi:hypothetical protein